jgi:hypothetical protein
VQLSSGLAVVEPAEFGGFSVAVAPPELAGVPGSASPVPHPPGCRCCSGHG